MTEEASAKTNNYQLFPSLLPEEYEALKTSIQERGVEVPIITDEEGNIIDGYHREKACSELNLNCPREVRVFESESEKYELALILNCQRRQLNIQQKKEVIRDFIKCNPNRSSRSVSIITGMSDKTITKIRNELEATSEIPKLEKLEGNDGKKRPRSKRILAHTAREEETAREIIKDLPDNCNGKTLGLPTAKKRAAKERNRKNREEQIQHVKPLTEDDMKLFHCKFQDLETIANIESNSVNLVLTDIPYGQEFLPEVEELGKFASRILVEGGLFITYSGQFWIHKILNAFSKNLTYRWINCSVWDGKAVPVHVGGWKEPHAQVLSKWKPIVIFSKGGFPKKGQWCDVTHVAKKEKDWHEWQQPLEEVEKLVKYFSEPGDLVVDPCGGAFTTAIACKNLNRRFIGCDVEANCVEIGKKRLGENQ